MINFFKNWKKNYGYIVWLCRYSKPYVPKISFLLILDIISSLLSVGLAVISKQIIDSASGGNAVIKGILIYAIITIGMQFINVITGLVSVMMNEKFSFGIRKQIYDKIINSHWMDVTKYHTGDLMTRLTSDASNIADGVVITIPTIIRLGIELCITFFTLLYYEPLIAFFALFIAPVAALSSIWLSRKLKKIQIKVQESEAAYRSFLQESLANLLIVKSFSNEDYAVDHLTQLRDNRFHWVWKRSVLSMASSTAMTLSFHVGYIGAFTIGAIQMSRNLISFGTMSVFLTLVNRVQAPVLGLAQLIPQIVSITASAGRIMELQDIPLEEKNMKPLEAKNIGVEIQNLTFAYSDENILEDTSLTIRPNEFVAIVGESGIGKTTLIRILMSFMNDVGGTIRFSDYMGHSELADAGSREFISYVPQGNTLFSGTIIENIRMGRLDATEEEVIEALKLASGYEFVKGLPKGINTVIGERGLGLSEGQAQRIAIARALVRKAPVLILDEATSALDEKTELSVLQGIQRLEPKPTCLLITHRRSVLKYCNREICIVNKKLEEQLI